MANSAQCHLPHVEFGQVPIDMTELVRLQTAEERVVAAMERAGGAEKRETTLLERVRELETHRDRAEIRAAEALKDVALAHQAAAEREVRAVEQERESQARMRGENKTG